MHKTTIPSLQDTYEILKIISVKYLTQSMVHSKYSIMLTVVFKKL